MNIIEVLGERCAEEHQIRHIRVHGAFVPGTIWSDQPGQVRRAVNNIGVSDEEVVRAAGRDVKLI